MRTLLCVAAVVALLAPAAVADDLYTPEWRGAPTSTYQHWSFDNQWPNYDHIVPEQYTNPYGQPYINATQWEAWYPTYEGRQGVAYVDYYDYFEMYIPNHDLDWPDKFIYLQVTYSPNGLVPEPDVYIPFGDQNTVMLQDHQILADGWIWDLWYIHIWPNPALEEIDFWGGPYGDPGLLIDQIVIDTICIPEPATLGLLAFAGVLLLRRR